MPIAPLFAAALTVSLSKYPTRVFTVTMHVGAARRCRSVIRLIGWITEIRHFFWCCSCSQKVANRLVFPSDISDTLSIPPVTLVRACHCVIPTSKEDEQRKSFMNAGSPFTRSPHFVACARPAACLDSCTPLPPLRSHGRHIKSPYL